MLIELPKADEIDDLAISTPRLEVRKLELDLSNAKADLNYRPCKGQIVLAVRSTNGFALVRRSEEKGWLLPSDRIGPNEEIQKSAKRVAKEQCGLMLRSLELAGIYDVIWHYSDISIKRLHFVYVALTDDSKCVPGEDVGILEARFFREVPERACENQIHRLAMADCSAK